MTPIIYAATYNNVHPIMLLMESGADTNKRSSTGFSALVTAATQ